MTVLSSLFLQTILCTFAVGGPLLSYDGALSNCATGFFGCFDGLCLPQEWVCDGTKDCSDGEDEICQNYEYMNTEKDPGMLKNKRSFEEDQNVTFLVQSTTPDLESTTYKSQEIPSIGVSESSIGVNESSTGVSESSGGVSESSTSVSESSTGVSESSTGVSESSTGVSESTKILDFINPGNPVSTSTQFSIDEFENNFSDYIVFSPYSPDVTIEDQKTSQRPDIDYDYKTFLPEATSIVTEEVVTTDKQSAYDYSTTQSSTITGEHTTSHYLEGDRNNSKAESENVLKPPIKILEKAVNYLQVIRENLKKEQNKLINYSLYENNTSNGYIEQLTTTIKPPRTAVAKLTCPHNFKFIRGHCIYVQIYPPMSWYDALAVCRAQGGYLALVQTREFYNVFLKQLNFDRMAVYDIWIGATSYNPSGVMQWIDGKPITHRHIWNEQALDAHEQTYKCGFMDGRKFSFIGSDHCYKQKGFTCHLPSHLSKPN